MLFALCNEETFGAPGENLSGIALFVDFKIICPPYKLCLAWLSFLHAFRRIAKRDC
jgi:hypothetical protein